MTSASQRYSAALRPVLAQKPVRVRLLHQLIGLALAVLIPMTLFSVWAVAEAIDAQRRAARAQLAAMARTVASLVESELDTRRAALQALASSPIIDRAGQDCDLHEWAARVGQANETWVVVSGPRQAERYPQIVNTRLNCGAQGHFSGLEPTLERVFQTGRPAVAPLFTGRGSGKQMIAVAVPIERDGRVKAVLSMPIEPPQLSALLSEIADDVTLSLIDTNHAVVARSADNLIGMSIPATTVAAAAGLRSGVILAKTADGQDLAIGFQQLTSAPGWAVIAGMPARRYAGGWAGPSGRLLLGGAVALAVALLLAAAIARRLLRPMRRLTAAYKALRAGNAAPWSLPLRSGTAELDALALALARAQLAVSRRAAARREVLRALAMQERRYRALAEVGSLVAWRAGGDGRILEQHGWAELTGLPPETALGEGWLAAIHPDDRAHAGTAWAEALRAGRPVDVEYRVPRPGVEEWRWVRAKGVPVRRQPGDPVEEWVGLLEDAHERRSQEERQVLLAREVDHRAKNALAVVQAALRLTRAADLGSYVRAVEGRISALARAHNLLAADQWKGASLHAMLTGELAPFLAEGEEAPRAALKGPALMLPALVAQPLGMTVHELATNAVKHGALSVPGGRVAVTWRRERVDGRDVLRLRWEETGGPPVAGVPTRRGFGSRVVESTIRNQLRGEVVQSWAAEGFACDIAILLSKPDMARTRSATKWAPQPMPPSAVGGQPRMA